MSGCGHHLDNTISGLTAAPHELGLSAERLKQISPTVQKFIDEEQLAGAVTIVARRGKIAHFKAYGMMELEAQRPMQKDTIFRIYSMSKPFAAVGAMMLLEEGKITLDAPAAEYLPELDGLKVTEDADTEEVTLVAAERELTVRDLLRHTSGLPGSNRYMDGKTAVDKRYRKAGLHRLSECNLQEMVERLGTIPLLYQPGTKWHYSIAADVSGRLIEVVSGQSFDAFLSERIFQPLGMADTSFYVPAEKMDRFAGIYGPKPTGGLMRIDAPEGGTGNLSKTSFIKPPKFLSAGGGLVSTATDYMRFCLMLSNKGTLAGKRLLKAETVEIMIRNQLPLNLLPISREPAGRGFGLGFAVRVEKIDSEPSSVGEYEWLGGAGTEFFLSPRDEMAVVTLSQQLPMCQLGRTLKPIIYGAIDEDRSQYE
jgi:CubicO group peptidase (beta-lactamase class C family)